MSSIQYQNIDIRMEFNALKNKKNTFLPLWLELSPKLLEVVVFSWSSYDVCFSVISLTTAGLSFRKKNENVLTGLHCQHYTYMTIQIA